MRKFHREILDPADGIAVFEKRFDEQHIGAVLSNKSVRLLKSMCGTANMVPRVAANDCDQPLLANDSIAHRHDPARFFARAKWRAFFHGYAGLTNRPRPLQSFNCVFYENISGNCRAKFSKNFRKTQNYLLNTAGGFQEPDPL
jgi:hypothetical protein